MRRATKSLQATYRTQLIFFRRWIWQFRKKAFPSYGVFNLDMNYLVTLPTYCFTHDVHSRLFET